MPPKQLTTWRSFLALSAAAQSWSYVRLLSTAVHIDRFCITWTRKKLQLIYNMQHGQTVQSKSRGWSTLALIQKAECPLVDCCDSALLSSAPSSKVSRQLLCASLWSLWSPASAICQMSSTVSSTSSPQYLWDIFVITLKEWSAFSTMCSKMPKSISICLNVHQN